MIRMTKWFVLCALLALTATVNMGQVVCSEDPVKGCVVNLPTPAFVWAASDGEAPFDPWGFGANTSDGVSFFGLSALDWVPDTSFPGMDGKHWVQCPGCTGPGANTWILPANVGDLAGAWFLPGFTISSPELFTILEGPNGPISDTITIANTGPNGTVEVVMQSDSNIPEPSSLLLFGSGLLGAVGVARRRYIS